MKTMLAAGAMLATMSAHAVAADGASKCPFTDELTGFTEVDETTITVDVAAQRYKITFAAPCRSMQHASRARVMSKPGICLEPGDSLIFPAMAGENSVCVIKTIELVPAKH